MTDQPIPEDAPTGHYVTNEQWDMMQRDRTEALATIGEMNLTGRRLMAENAALRARIAELETAEKKT